MVEPLPDASVVKLVVLTLMSVVLVALAVLGAVAALRHLRRRTSWTRTSAEVVRSWTRKEGRGNDATIRTFCRYEYRSADGRLRSGTGELGWVAVDEEGGTRRFELLVDPTDPSRSVPLRRTVLIALMVGPLAAVAALVGVVLLLGVLASLLT